MKQENPKKIIVRLPNWIGDSVMATPFLHLLPKAFPKGYITVIGRKWVTDLFLHFPGIHELWAIDDKKNPLSMISLIKKIKHSHFDIGFLLANSFRSALVFYLGGIKKRIGYSKDLRRLLLTHPKEITDAIMALPMVEYYARLLSDYTDIDSQHLLMRLYPDEKEREKAKSLLVQNGWNGKTRLVGINPFAFQWITKRWFPERFAKVADQLIDSYGVGCVFVGMKRDRPLFEKIRKMCKNPLIDLVGKLPLPVVPAVLEKYALFITNDSGLMHIAAAMDTPIIALFGPTDWKRTAPFSQKAVVIRKQLDHEPCMKPKCCRAFECMDKITVQEVIDEAKKHLD